MKKRPKYRLFYGPETKRWFGVLLKRGIPVWDTVEYCPKQEE